MIGAIIGDIVGSRFEWNNIHTKKFTLFTSSCFPTDDSIMTLAVGKAIMECRGDYTRLGEIVVRSMQDVGRPYPDCGYGGRFAQWMYSDHPQPYNSFGNGAAMRVSACGEAAKTLEEAKVLSRKATEVTYNHPEGLKGAEATAIWMARNGESKEAIRDYVNEHYYPMNFTLEEIRPTYRFNETCQQTVPQALMAFFESTDFEDAIRNAISLGGDSDTLAAITGSVGEAFYGVPVEMELMAASYLDERLMKIYEAYPWNRVNIK